MRKKIARERRQLISDHVRSTLGKDARTSLISCFLTSQCLSCISSHLVEGPIVVHKHRSFIIEPIAKPISTLSVYPHRKYVCPQTLCRDRTPFTNSSRQFTASLNMNWLILTDNNHQQHRERNAKLSTSSASYT